MQCVQKAMTSFRFGREAFVRSGSLCYAFSAPLSPLPKVRGREGLAGGRDLHTGAGSQRAEQNWRWPNLDSFSKEDCDVLERAQDSESVRSKFQFYPDSTSHSFINFGSFICKIRFSVLCCNVEQMWNYSADDRTPFLSFFSPFSTMHDY